MKKFYVIAFTLMLMLVLAACDGESNNTPPAPPEVTEVPTDPPAEAPVETAPNITYTYEGYFTIEIPADWENKYIVEEDELGPIFINTANKDAGWAGTLFSIIGYDIAEWEEQETDIIGAIGLHLTELGEANGRMFVLVTPGDVNYDVNDEALTKEYQEMINSVETIAASFKASDFINSIDGLAIQDVAYNAATAMLHADAEKLSPYMSDSTVAISAVQNLTYISDDLVSFDLAWSPDNIISDDKVTISYKYTVLGKN